MSFYKTRHRMYRKRCNNCGKFMKNTPVRIRGTRYMVALLESGGIIHRCSKCNSVIGNLLSDRNLND